MAKAPSISPIKAFGLTKEIQPRNPEFWNYERLSHFSPEQIIAALKMVIIITSKYPHGLQIP